MPTASVSTTEKTVVCFNCGHKIGTEMGNMIDVDNRMKFYDTVTFQCSTCLVWQVWTAGTDRTVISPAYTRTVESGYEIYKKKVK